MRDHAAPGGDQAAVQEAGEHKGPQDPDAPHARHVERKRRPGLARPLEHALHHDGDAENRLRAGHHPQHRDPQVDDLGVLAEQADHLGGEGKVNHI